MEETSASIEKLYEKAQDYIKTNIELARLKTLDKVSDAASSLVPRMIVFLLMLMFILSANIAVSLWLGDIMGKNYYGFATVAVFYVLLAIVIRFFAYQRIKEKIRGLIIENLFN